MTNLSNKTLGEAEAWRTARDSAAEICDYWAREMRRRIDDPGLTQAARDAALVQEPILMLCASAIMNMEQQA